MSKPAIGMLVGAVLGICDGLSAWAYPEARSMMATIVIGSTLKGLVTGALVGLVARWKASLPLGLGAGLVIGFALSALAALPQPGHFWPIVLPGMLLGVIVGFVTERHPRKADAPPTAWTPRAVLIAALMLTAGVSGASLSSAPDPLAPLAFMIGRWEGTSEGQPGTGTVEREYSRILGSRFVQGRSRSTYPPQEKNPKGEIHEHADLFSFDRARQRIVLRQFHIEGFVNQYVFEAASTPDRIVFTTEAIENIAAGWRARETYVVAGPGQFEEIFELAEPGKDFEVYLRNRLKRVRPAE